MIVMQTNSDLDIVIVRASIVERKRKNPSFFREAKWMTRHKSEHHAALSRSDRRMKQEGGAFLSARPDSRFDSNSTEITHSDTVCNSLESRLIRETTVILSR